MKMYVRKPSVFVCARRLLDSQYSVDILKPFRMINIITSDSLLHIDNIMIKRLNPHLSTQRDAVLNLSLTW